MAVAEIAIRGIEPLVIARFSKKAELMQKMAEGGAAKNKKDRKARDCDVDKRLQTHFNRRLGWYMCIGVPGGVYISLSFGWL